MRALLQRVTRAQVLVEGEIVGSIGRGWAILLAVGHDDDETAALQMAMRIARLRAFEDPAGKMNLSIGDVTGEALVVSQFTLFADTARGRRPSFVGAARPDQAVPLIQVFVSALEEQGLRVAQGRFGAHMLVDLVNDGPVTLALSSPGDPWGG